MLAKRLFTVRETAFLLNVPPSTLKGWIQRKQLRSRLWVRKMGSFKRVIDSVDLGEFIEQFFPRSDEISPTSQNPRRGKFTAS